MAKAKKRAATFFVHGEPGIGKTELVAQFKNPVFICDVQEDGVQDLVDFGFISVETIWYPTSFKEFMEMLDRVKTGEYGETCVIETLRGWEVMMHDFGYKEFKFTNRQKWESFAEGPRACEKLVRDVIDKLQAIRSNGVTVVMTGHTKDSRVQNPTLPEYHKMVPEATKSTWFPLAKWFQNIFYMALNVSVAKDNENDVTERAWAFSCGERVLYTSKDAAYEAKNRYRLPPSISMGNSGEEGFLNLRTAITEALNA